MKFTKMQGLGNDYIYVNCFEEQVADPAAVARLISDRHFGVGGDGLILMCSSSVADVRMEMYNADGSRAQMCGNGIRCVAKYAYERGLSRANPMAVETDAGVLQLELLIEGQQVTQVRVDMGVPVLDPARMPARLEGARIIDAPLEANGRRYDITCVSMGNPHVVVFVEDLEAIDLPSAGSRLEQHPAFPQRTNVHFAKVLSPIEVRMVSWERGSGATLACGTGACAVAHAGFQSARLRQPTVTVHLPGGDLEIEQATLDGPIFMTGPAAEVFTGDWPGLPTARAGDS